jgi:cobalt-zinc-cadmium efflux system protein
MTFESRRQKVRLLQVALLLLSLFFVAELITASASHSLSLAADASHVLSDVGALGITLSATRLAQRSASARSRAGLARGETIAALINGVLLLLVAGWIGGEAIARLDSPNPDIQGLPMLIIALVGLGINSFNALWLHRCSCGDLNLKGAFLHVVADLVSSVGAILAAIAVAWLHWNWADGAIGLLVSGAIVVLSLPLLVKSLHLLLARVPPTPPLSICPDRQVSEKLLFPSLEDVLKS